MKINYRTIESYGLTLEEFLILLLKDRNVDEKELEESLKEKDMLFRSDNECLDGTPTKKGHDVVTQTLRDSFDKMKTKRFENLANQLRELFPKGYKDGKYAWRGSTKIIADRLAIAESKFGEFSDEQAIEATKRYVKAYDNGNEPGMRILPYFIIKAKKEDGLTELVSDLMSYIENKDIGNNVNDDSWTREMR